MKKLCLSRADLLDYFSGYSMKTTIRHKLGHDIILDVIAFSDIDQALDEFMEDGDYFHIISKTCFTINDYVWYKERIHRISNIENNKIEIFDLETRSVKTVTNKDIKICL